jgi:hypothetical protein
MMKSKLIVSSLIMSAFSTGALALEVTFVDDAWGGDKVPAGQQCQKFGGINPSTPRLMVSHIPANTDAIILEYSDRDSEKMNNGGHGRMSYQLVSSVSEVDIPSIPGHTSDIPAPFTIIEEHRSPGWDTAGAYMPPCSGGKGHEYYVTVKSVMGDKITDTTVLEMGKY